MKVERSEILATIDFELRAYADLLHQNGWSRWVLLGALVAAVGSLFTIIEAGNPSFQRLFQLFTGASLLVLPFVSVFVPTFRSINAKLDPAPGRLVPAAHEFNMPLSNAVVQSTWLGVLAYGVWRFASGLPDLVRWLTIVVMVLGVCLYVASVVLSKFDMLVPSRPKPHPAVVIGIVPILGLSFFTGVWLCMNIAPIQPIELKVVAIVIGILMILLILGELDPYSHQRRQLIILRREITLIPLDDEAAVSRLDFILRGAALPELVRPHLDSFLSAQTRVLSMLADIEKDLTVIRARFDKGEDPDEVRNALGIESSQIEAAHVASVQATAAYDRLYAVVSRLNLGVEQGLKANLDGWIKSVTRSQMKTAKRAEACVRMLKELQLALGDA